MVFPQSAACAHELLLTPVRGDEAEASNSEGSRTLRKIGSGAPPEIVGLALECLGALRVCSASARVYRPAPPKSKDKKRGGNASKATAPLPLTARQLLVARVCAWSSDVWLEVDHLQVTLFVCLCLCCMHACVYNAGYRCLHMSTMN